MRTLVGIVVLTVAGAAFSAGDALLDQDFRRLASDEVVNLADAYGGKVILVVNTASKCGNTPQYDGLENRFPMFEKVTVKEGEAHPFFDELAAAAGTYPTWNFHKYLIGRDGRLIAEFSPRTKPDDDKLVSSIKGALAL
jgi:glutathione peroxidase